ILVVGCLQQGQIPVLLVDLIETSMVSLFSVIFVTIISLILRSFCI
ncbi:hypothetical protein SAMN02745245_01371, partial [Anaerosphaera aminiphila DSM 21120]